MIIALVNLFPLIRFPPFFLRSAFNLHPLSDAIKKDLFASKRSVVQLAVLFSPGKT